MLRQVSRQAGSDSHEFSLGPLEATLSFLWFFVPLMSTVSLTSVTVSISTNHWLHTTEKMTNPAYNGTGDSDKEYLLKMTISGLWIYCFTNPGETMYQCNKIDYFSKEQYSPDPSDSTLAIPYTVTKSAAFLLAGGFVLLPAYLFAILGQCIRNRRTYTFLSGILFILTGLFMLLGLVMYISVFKAETGSKLRPQSQIRPPLYEYHYGYSFLMYLIGLIATQISGVGCVFLFIYRLQYEWKRKQLEEVKRGKRLPSVLNINQLDRTVYYPCRRHPYAYVNSNSVIHYPPTSPAQKRYYFSKEPTQESPCSVHRMRSQSNSLKDVSTFYDFPPPPTISYQFDEHFGTREHTLPRDVTLNTVNTVSTTADVNCDELNEPYFDDYSPSIQHEFVTFDLDQPLPIRAQSVVSISSRNGTRKNYESDSLRRTTPV
ncbi:uncharacterized protein LOC132699574 [Cylas formicarius]|uniref:uncharacterized protein LOC132699574 n=1 Tax=Cylas formicarius TaxID=197179 RepID=UPI002958775C|nr:uncharacterized protein LOC132699574 [Cylas formicarius]